MIRLGVGKSRGDFERGLEKEVNFLAASLLEESDEDVLVDTGLKTMSSGIGCVALSGHTCTRFNLLRKL